MPNVIQVGRHLAEWLLKLHVLTCNRPSERGLQIRVKFDVSLTKCFETIHFVSLA